MTLLYIIRHGETDYNRDGRYQGQSDIRMNETGRNQAAAVARKMARLDLTAIYSSDLNRAQECARVIASGTPVALDPRLREIDVGRVVGLTLEQIAQREPEFHAALRQDPDRVVFPGGESALDVHRRAMAAFEAIISRYPQGRVAVVTHGGLITLLTAEVIGLPLANRRRLYPQNGGITVLEWTADRRRLRSFNDTGHLDAAPSEMKTEI